VNQQLLWSCDSTPYFVNRQLLVLYFYDVLDVKFACSKHKIISLCSIEESNQDNEQWEWLKEDILWRSLLFTFKESPRQWWRKLALKNLPIVVKLQQKSESLFLFFSLPWIFDNVCTTEYPNWRIQRYREMNRQFENEGRCLQYFVWGRTNTVSSVWWRKQLVFLSLNYVDISVAPEGFWKVWRDIQRSSTLAYIEVEIVLLLNSVMKLFIDNFPWKAKVCGQTTYCQNNAKYASSSKMVPNFYFSYLRL
jgi:hypothetical protein